MKSARTYVVMFVQIPPGWFFHEPMIHGFDAASKGSFPANPKDNDGSRWPDIRRSKSEVEPLPNELFWTWFVDNPHQNLRRK